MLPDLRIVIAAVVSTFIFTVGVGFFASSRLIHEQMTTRVDTKGLDDTPINRIALNWPEPTKTERNVDLDFAVSAKVSRNPVRDITDVEPAANSGHAETSKSDARAAETPKAETPRLEVSKLDIPATVSPADTPGPHPAPAAPEPQKEAAPAPEQPVTVAKATDPVEDKSTNAVAPAIATDAPAPARPADEAADATGSVSAPASGETPDDPAPDAHPKFAARPEAGDAETAEIAKPARAEPVKTITITKRRPRRVVAKPRPVARIQPAPVQQVQPFDFFGLFRTPPGGFRFLPQTQMSASPAS